VNKVLVALFTLLFLNASAHAVDKIRIGVPELNAQFVPLPLADKRGFFREDGLQGEVIRINPTVALAALVSGELDYWTVIGNSVAAAIQGAPLRILTCYVPGSPSALIARPEFKSVQELRGKAVGLNTSGGALESMARLIFTFWPRSRQGDKVSSLGHERTPLFRHEAGVDRCHDGLSPVGFSR